MTKGYLTNFNLITCVHFYIMFSFDNLSILTIFRLSLLTCYCTIIYVTIHNIIHYYYYCAHMLLHCVAPFINIFALASIIDFPYYFYCYESTHAIPITVQKTLVSSSSINFIISDSIFSTSILLLCYCSLY